MNRSNVQMARALFIEICGSYSLESFERPDDPIELSVKVPEQQGMSAEIWLGLQNNDELCFGVAEFQGHWFPCTDSEVVESFHLAVDGFISGKNRVVLWRRGKRVVRAELQIPKEQAWETLYTHQMGSLWPFPLRRTVHEVQNA